MEKPKVSEDFTVDDIHKIREYHYEQTKDMTVEERIAFYNDSAKEFEKYLVNRKASNVSATVQS